MNMICFKCEQEKTEKEMRKNGYYCKYCDNKAAREYRRTKRGKLIQMYNDQLKNSKHRGYPQPSYTRDEFIGYMLNHDKFNDIYKNWEDSNFCNNLSPSIDRIDEYGTYSYDNIQIVTWHENNMLAYQRRKDGLNNKQSKKVAKVLNGDVVAVYHSINQAARENNTTAGHISEVSCKKRKQAGGYDWKLISDAGHKNIKENK